MDDTVDSRVGKPVFTNRLSCHLPLLSFFSNLFPFAIGDLFIFGSITGVIVYPFYARIRKKLPWKKILLRDGEYLLWVYVWFYLAWGLNYSQPNFYQRTHIPYTAYTPEIFQEFVDDYIDSLNSSFVPVKGIHEEQVRDEAVKLYNQLSDSLGVHRPPFPNPRVKTMIFTPFISMVGVTGSMGPFFCEFTLNGDLLPHQLSGNVHSRTGSSAGNFERGRGQFLCLSGLYPFTNKKESVSAGISRFWIMYWGMPGGCWVKKNTPI